MLPRIVMSLIWSIFWIGAVSLLQNPAQVTLNQFLTVTTVYLILTPIQIWVYNGYFIMVQQFNEEQLDLRAASKSGFRKIPQGLAAFLLIAATATAAGLPGLIIMMYGTVLQHLLLQVVGGILVLGAVITVIILSFFAPASVVIGHQSFVQNVKHGVYAAHRKRSAVTLITAFSFATLLLTQFLHSGLEYVGMIGFVIGRLVAAVIGVYILVVNPKLFLQTTDTVE